MKSKYKVRNVSNMDLNLDKNIVLNSSGTRRVLSTLHIPQASQECEQSQSDQSRTHGDEPQTSNLLPNEGFFFGENLNIDLSPLRQVHFDDQKGRNSS